MEEDVQLADEIDEERRHKENQTLLGIIERSRVLDRKAPFASDVRTMRGILRRGGILMLVQDKKTVSVEKAKVMTLYDHLLGLYFAVRKEIEDYGQA